MRYHTHWFTYCRPKTAVDRWVNYSISGRMLRAATALWSFYGPRLHKQIKRKFVMDKYDEQNKRKFWPMQHNSCERLEPSRWRSGWPDGGRFTSGSEGPVHSPVSALSVSIDTLTISQHTRGLAVGLLFVNTERSVGIRHRHESWWCWSTVAKQQLQSLWWHSDFSNLAISASPNNSLTDRKRRSTIDQLQVEKSFVLFFET